MNNDKIKSIYSSDVEIIKNSILSIVDSGVSREGKDKLKQFLLDSDYFTAPASKKYHEPEVGGLAKHSLIVYYLLKEKVKFLGFNIPLETIVVSALFHDLCKIGCYTRRELEKITDKQLSYLVNLSNRPAEDFINISKQYGSALISHYKNNAQGEPPTEDNMPPEWDIEDQLPLGHGEKSVIILLRCIGLTDEELMAIRWHMSFSDPSTYFKYPNGFAYKKAMHMTPLTVLLFTADFESKIIYDFVNCKEEK